MMVRKQYPGDPRIAGIGIEGFQIQCTPVLLRRLLGRATVLCNGRMVIDRRQMLLLLLQVLLQVRSRVPRECNAQIRLLPVGDLLFGSRSFSFFLNSTLPWVQF